MPTYLDDRSNLVGTRLLTKCRLGYVMLLQSVGKMLNWPPARCTCVMCEDDAVESMQHYLVECGALEPCRVRFRTEARAALRLAGGGSQRAMNALVGPPDEQLRLVLGGLELFGVAGEPEDVGKAAWAFDKATKNFLVACWRHRAHLIGHLSVQHGALVCEPATDARVMGPGSAPSRTPQQMEQYRPFWSDWVPRARDVAEGRKKRSKARSAFFVVWAGRRAGIFTTWRECMSSVAGFPQAKFRGFAGLREAQCAWRDGAAEDDG